MSTHSIFWSESPGHPGITMDTKQTQRLYRLADGTVRLRKIGTFGSHWELSCK